MSGRFEVYQDSTGRFRFRLKAGQTPVAGPVRRQFRFAGGMAAEQDLAARSGEILRDELRQRS